MTENILLVDDDPATIQLLARILSSVGALRFATGGADALRLAQELVPDLILLDAQMPGMSGFQVCELLKADPLLAEVPVIFVTSHREAEFEVAGFEIGAADFIVKPVTPALVLARVKAQLRVKRMADELRRVSAIDGLTGVANRRRFDDSLAREWQRSRRNGEPMALLMVDVDHFKFFNDCYGHPAGDACLRAVAQALASVSLRPTDLLARYGGEEFVLLLPGTPRRGAEYMARRALGAVAAMALGHAASPTAGHVTASVGVGCYDDGSACWTGPSSDSRLGSGQNARTPSAASLVEAADRALYAAKRAGRAQCWLLDVSDIDQAELAHELAPLHRPEGSW